MIKTTQCIMLCKYAFIIVFIEKEISLKKTGIFIGFFSNRLFKKNKLNNKIKIFRISFEIFQKKSHKENKQVIFNFQ